jgi:hypothetical protein
VISYHLPAGQAGIQKSGVTRLAVYDVLGREVAVLVDGENIPGYYTVKWDARGRSSGIYYYQLRADGTVTTKKMVFLR